MNSYGNLFYMIYNAFSLNKAVVRIVVNINYREAEVLSYPELTG